MLEAEDQSLPQTIFGNTTGMSSSAKSTLKRIRLIGESFVGWMDKTLHKVVFIVRLVVG